MKKQDEKTAVHTKKEYTPEEVLSILKDGNEEFVKGRFFMWDQKEREKSIEYGQHPKAVILSCIDSRIPARDVFHCDVGDIFIARIAGNVIGNDVLASFEYACKISGSKLIVIMGHNHCGAIKAAIDGVEGGNIAHLLAKIRPAIQNAETRFEPANRNSRNIDFVDAVCIQNVKDSIKEVRKKSFLLKKMEENHEIMIVGAMYDMKTGKVHFFDNV